MYPVLFWIGGFELTSFGVMVAIAALVGVWLFRRELRRSGLPVEFGDAGIVGVMGGLLGAKLLWTVEHATEGPISELLLSRGVLSWYGGLIGGVGQASPTSRSSGRRSYRRSQPRPRRWRSDT